MLDFIKEDKSVWELLSTIEQPIVLYGMGNGADKIVDWCESHNVKISGIFASDEFVRGQLFRGFKVEKYSDIIERLGHDVLIVIAFASERPEVLARFRELAASHDVVAPHLPLFKEAELVSKDWLERYAKELQQVYAGLADDFSRQVFSAALNYKLSGKISYLFACETQRLEDLKSIFSFASGENYLDLGAYNGDTVQEFLQLTDNKFNSIIAVEPDRRNCRKLRALRDVLGLDREFVVYEAGVWNEKTVLSFSDSGGRQSTFIDASKAEVNVDTIDNFAAATPISYIKMDVEGAELQALAGGKATLGQYSPKLFIAAYHYDADLFRIPLAIWQLVPEYKIYLRKHPYVPAWELNFLCVK